MKITNFFGLTLFFINGVLNSTIKTQQGHVHSHFLSSSNLTFDYSIIKDLIVFGDSYSDVNTNYDNMTYTGENHSGGKNWPLQLIELHDMFLWDFAYGGARMSSKYTIQKHPCSLETQYEYFKLRMIENNEHSKWDSESSIFAFWFGINDMIKTKQSQDNTVKLGLGDLFNTIGEIYNYGARNFLIFNVPPVDKAPFFISGAFLNTAEFVDKFNAGILEKIEEFSKGHQDANVILYNAFDEFNYIMDHHKEYGLTELKKDYNNYSTRDRDTFFWNDSNHPTDKVHKIFAEDLHNFLNNNSINKSFKSSTNKADANKNMESSGAERFINKLSHVYFSLIIYILYYIFF